MQKKERCLNLDNLEFLPPCSQLIMIAPAFLSESGGWPHCRRDNLAQLRQECFVWFLVGPGREKLGFCGHDRQPVRPRVGAGIEQLPNRIDGFVAVDLV